MRINLKFYLQALLVFLLAIFMYSCSTQPKDKGDVFTLRNHAEAGLEQGNREAGRGNYEGAYLIILESKRNAILTDDPSLIIRCCLSLGNVLFDMDRLNEAFLQWDQAIAEAQRADNRELLAVSRIFRARGELTLRASAQSILELINSEQAYIKSDRRNIAFSWQAKGLALRALGSYDEAENAFMRSLEIHQKDLYLENASYDWYTIASIRSIAGNTQGAIEALQASIEIDRRIENSWGLAASYRAMGDVYLRAGENQKAEEAFARAIQIYEAMGNAIQAAETRRRSAQ